MAAAPPTRTSPAGVLARTEAALRWLNYRMAVLSGLLIVAMIVIVLYEIIMRYVFNDPTIWAFDISRFLLAYVLFLGLALALQDGTHVSVDLVLEMVPERVRWWLRLIAHLMTVAFGLVFTWQLAVHTEEAFRLDWRAVSMLATPLKYIYIVGPIGAAVFVLTAVQLLLGHLAGYSRPKAAAGPNVDHS